MSRASTSFFACRKQDMDGRDKPGHDERNKLANLFPNKLQRTAVKNRPRRKPDNHVVTGWLRMPRSQEPTTASARPTKSSIGNSPTPPSLTGTRLSAELSRLSPLPTR